MAQQKPSRGNRSSPHQRKRRNRPAPGRTVPRPDHALENRSDWEPFRTRTLPLILLVLVTLIAYANAWPNNLVGDDPTFAVIDRFSGLGLAGVARFFANDLWAVNGFDSGLYRPLLLVSMMIDTHVFGDWVAGYHLTNILLHVLVTVLVYGLVRYLLLASGGQSPSSGHIALLAAMIFGVHPIHTEAINSIFNRSEILVSLAVVGGLWWFLKTREIKPKKAWSGLCVIYLLALFCKESGATLPALAVILLWTTSPENWRVRLQKSLPVFLLLIPLGVYLVLRDNALNPASVLSATGMPTTEQSGQLTALLNYDTGRLLQAARVWADALRITLWPHPLLLYHGKPETHLWTALALQLTLFGIAISGYMYKRPGLIIGLAFFYIAILPSSGVVGPLEYANDLGERFLYLPTVGLTIALAFGLRAVVQRFSLRLAMTTIVIFTALLTPITWARNAEWATDLLLFEAEYRKGSQTGYVLQALVVHNLKAKNTSQALKICQMHANTFKENSALSYQCGVAYEGVGRYDDAKQAYILALNSTKPERTSRAYLALALMNVRLDHQQEAKKYFEQSIALMDKSFLREFHTALMLIKLYPFDQPRLLQAKTHLEQTLQLQPEYFPAHRMLEQLNEILGPGGRFDKRDRP